MNLGFVSVSHTSEEHVNDPHGHKVTSSVHGKKEEEEEHRGTSFECPGKLWLTCSDRYAVDEGRVG